MRVDTLARPDGAREAGMLVRPGWPRGFCPVHAMTGMKCVSWCVPVRREFAVIASDLERYWHEAEQHRRWEDQYGPVLRSN